MKYAISCMKMPYVVRLCNVSIIVLLAQILYADEHPYQPGNWTEGPKFDPACLPLSFFLPSLWFQVGLGERDFIWNSYTDGEPAIVCWPFSRQ